MLGALVLITASLSGATEIQVVLSNTATPALHGPAGGSGTTWNTRFLSDSPLNDSAGNPTSVNFTADGRGPFGDWWCDLELLTGGVFDEGGGTRPFRITGLDPGKTYDLHIASSWGGNGGHTVFQTPNTSDTPSPQTADNHLSKNASTWQRGANFVLFQNIVPDTSGSINLTYGGVGTYGILNGFQLVDSGVIPTTFETWAADPARGLTTGTNDGPLDDPDHDGIHNLLEFVLGGEPVLSSSPALPVLSGGGAEWFFEYHRSDLSNSPAILQIVEYSTDLVTWTPVPVPAVSGNGVTITPAGTFDHVKVVLPDLGNGGFARLRATR